MTKVPQATCIRCQEAKPIFSFPRVIGNRKKFSKACFKCCIADPTLYYLESNTIKCKGQTSDLPHKTRRQVSQSSRRAKEYGVKDTLTKDEWEIILANAKGCCTYCGKNVGADNLGMDHVIPLSKGGSNSAGNIVAACKLCNFRKGSNTKPPKKLNIGDVRPALAWEYDCVTE